MIHISHKSRIITSFLMQYIESYILYKESYILYNESYILYNESYIPFR